MLLKRTNFVAENPNKRTNFVAPRTKFCNLSFYSIYLLPMIGSKTKRTNLIAPHTAAAKSRPRRQRPYILNGRTCGRKQRRLPPAPVSCPLQSKFGRGFTAPTNYETQRPSRIDSQQICKQIDWLSQATHTQPVKDSTISEQSSKIVEQAAKPTAHRRPQINLTAAAEANSLWLSLTGLFVSFAAYGRLCRFIFLYFYIFITFKHLQLCKFTTTERP